MAAMTVVLRSSLAAPPPLRRPKSPVGTRKSKSIITGSRAPRSPRFRCKAEDTGSDDGSGGGTTLETAAIAGGLVANPVIGVSLYTLKTTGCGLPPGPGGLLGAAEGVSYLVVAGVIGWSLYTRARTGSGLPAGPYGLLGAVEGLSYLTALGILAVFGLQFLERGYLPGPLPGDPVLRLRGPPPPPPPPPMPTLSTWE